jgi:signal transduction histidine kinase/CheY-like chemotaxis protein
MTGKNADLQHLSACDREESRDDMPYPGPSDDRLFPSDGFKPMTGATARQIQPMRGGEPRSRSQMVILHVDDTHLTRQLVTGILEQAGFGVYEATTGGEALALASKLLPDVIVLDVELPDIRGLEVARQLKTRDATSRIPVLHLSATRVTTEDLVRGLDAGADAYLVHPVDPQVLISTIRALLRMKNTVERIASLQAVTALLSDAATPQEIARALLGDGLVAAGASAGSLATMAKDNASLEIIGASPRWPVALSGDLRRISMSQSAPLSICVWTGVALWIASHEALEADYPHLAEASGSMAGVEAVACLPLTFGGRIRGALGFTFATPSALTEVNRSFLLTLATECTHALERIHLYEAERGALRAAELAAAQERAARFDQTLTEGALRASIRAREDLLAIVSHDLRNPLNAVVMTASLVKARIAAGQIEHSDKYLDRILKATERMTVLIDDLLDAASIESGRFTLDRESHPVDAIVTDVTEILAPMAKEKSIQLGREVVDRPIAECDRKRVVQVLSNLIGNAIKFTPPGGSIGVRVATEDDQVLITVSDTGPGIPEDRLPHLFDRYWTGHRREGAGTGLGLFIVKGIVETHGGRVSIKSQPGAGSSFSFTLPIEARGAGGPRDG